MFQVQSSQKQKEKVIPELKPSMARAPKLRKKLPVEQQPGLKMGVSLEYYDPEKHNK